MGAGGVLSALTWAPLLGWKGFFSGFTENWHIRVDPVLKSWLCDGERLVLGSLCSFCGHSAHFGVFLLVFMSLLLVLGSQCSFWGPSAELQPLLLPRGLRGM